MKISRSLILWNESLTTGSTNRQQKGYWSFSVCLLKQNHWDSQSVYSGICRISYASGWGECISKAIEVFHWCKTKNKKHQEFGIFKIENLPLFKYFKKRFSTPISSYNWSCLLIWFSKLMTFFKLLTWNFAIDHLKCCNNFSTLIHLLHCIY